MLTLLGVGGFINTSILYVNCSGEFKILSGYGILGDNLVFSGVSLIKRSCNAEGGIFLVVGK